MQKKIWQIGLLLLIVIALASSFLAGVIMGFEERPAVRKITALINLETDQPASVDFTPFWETWNIIKL